MLAASWISNKYQQLFPLARAGDIVCPDLAMLSGELPEYVLPPPSDPIAGMGGNHCWHCNYTASETGQSKGKSLQGCDQAKLQR